MKIIASSVVLIVLLGLAVNVTLEYQNRNYSADYFSFMTYEDSLESRQWLREGLTEGLGCTYAIVSLSESSPDAPPAQWLNERTWYRTPMIFKESAKSTYCHNLICECKENWSKETMNLLDKVLRNPDSFYYFHKHRPPHSEMGQGVIYIYSKAEKVAARVRFGD